MRVPLTSMVAQLLYVERPLMNFARLVREFETALDDCAFVDRRLVWDHDDIAIFDIGGSRITISFLDELPGDYVSCLCVSVGYGPGTDPDLGIGDRQEEIARVVVSRISRHLAPDSVTWQTLSGIVTPDVIDALAEGFHPAAEPLAPVHVVAPVTPDLVERLARTTEKHFEARFVPPSERKAVSFRSAMRARMFLRPTAAGAPMPATITVANSVPDVPKTNLSDARRIRSALYADDIDQTRSSVKLRLATHAINATLIVIALPVGASMMTYSLLRGESLTTSARALAVMGTLMGLQYSPVGEQVMAML